VGDRSQSSATNRRCWSAVFECEKTADEDPVCRRRAWWRCRESNPGPKKFNTNAYKLVRRHLSHPSLRPPTESATGQPRLGFSPPLARVSASAHRTPRLASPGRPLSEKGRGGRDRPQAVMQTPTTAYAASGSALKERALKAGTFSAFVLLPDLTRSGFSACSPYLPSPVEAFSSPQCLHDSTNGLVCQFNQVTAKAVAQVAPKFAGIWG